MTSYLSYMVGDILNIHQMHYRQSLNITFGTQIKKSMVFKTFKNKQCIIPRNKTINENPSWCVKN